MVTWLFWNFAVSRDAARRAGLPATAEPLVTRAGNSHYRVSVCVCLCVSHAGIVSKRLYVGSRKEHNVIAQGI